MEFKENNQGVSWTGNWLINSLSFPNFIKHSPQLWGKSAECLWSRWILKSSVSPVEYSGLISFRIAWFDPLAVQGTLKSLLQHHSSKASIIWHSPFFMAQTSHPYMTTGKTIALTIWTFVSKVMSLLFKDCLGLVRNKYLLNDWMDEWKYIKLITSRQYFSNNINNDLCHLIEDAPSHLWF